MLRRRAGVVAQARQRKVGAQRVEMAERENAGGIEDAVRRFIADIRQIGRRKMLRQRAAHGAIQFEIGTVNHVREGIS